MQTRFLFSGGEVDVQAREYIEKRLERIGKLVPAVTECDVEVGETREDHKPLWRVEIMVKTPRNMFRAENATESIEASTDVAIDELEEQINKKKGKLRDLALRGLRSIKKKLTVDRTARF